MTDDDATKVQDAARKLAHHSVGDDGLLDTLRPYVGSISSTATREILDSVRCLVELAEKRAVIPVAVLSSIFHLTHTVRRWALDKDGMLMRNGLISAEDWNTLASWVHEVEEEYAKLLGILEDLEDERNGNGPTQNDD